MTGDERVALERRRTSSVPIDRPAPLLLLDRDHAGGRVALAESAAQQRRYLASALQPGHGGYSACGIATIAAEHVLSAAPDERHFDDLQIAFEPAVTSVRYKDCGPRAMPIALASIAWLAGDEERATRHLARCWPDGILDELTAEAIGLLLRRRGGELGTVLAKLAPRYVAAMAKGLWRRTPEALLHVQLLAALLVGAERGIVDLATLPDVIPYAPIDFLSFLLSAAPSS